VKFKKSRARSRAGAWGFRVFQDSGRVAKEWGKNDRDNEMKKRSFTFLDWSHISETKNDSDRHRGDDGRRDGGLGADGKYA
jgi:hypothetical protein